MNTVITILFNLSSIDNEVSLYATINKTNINNKTREILNHLYGVYRSLILKYHFS